MKPDDSQRHAESFETDSRLPLIVGIVGKRRLDAGNAALNVKLMQRFCEEFSRCVSFLDKKFPLTPKLLMCGGAAGVDICAAETVLRETNGHPAHPRWAVAIILPFEQSLFEADFEDADTREYLPRLHRLIENADRVTVKALRPLHQQPLDDSRLETEDIPRVAREALLRPRKLSAEQSAPGGASAVPTERQLHYEQQAMWMARQSTLFIAVCTPDETTKRLGSTARAVAFRRAALPDPLACQVIARSSEILTPSPFEDPDGGHVLWINPEAPAAVVDQPGLLGRVFKTAEDVPPARVLKPIHHIFNVRHDVAGASAAGVAAYAHPLADDPIAAHRGESALQPSDDRKPLSRDDARRQREAWLDASALLRAFEQYHQRLPAAGADPVSNGFPRFSSEDPVTYLARIRPSGGPIGQQHNDADQKLKLSQRGNALLFLVAVAAYEGYTEITHGRLGLLSLYLLALLATWVNSTLVRNQRLQRRSEDYRGVQEMLRVQLAWWGAGINRMVDRMHLRTTDTDLHLVREAASNIAMWALIRFRPTVASSQVNVPATRLASETSLDIRDIFGAGNGLPHSNLPTDRQGNLYYSSWIQDQASYFATKSHLQHQITIFGELCYSTTLWAALLALMSLLALLGANKWFEMAMPVTPAQAAMYGPVAFGVVGSLSLLWMCRTLSGAPAEQLGPRSGMSGLVDYINLATPRLWMAALLTCSSAGIALIGLRTAALAWPPLSASWPVGLVDLLGWLAPGIFLISLMGWTAVAVTAWTQGLDSLPSTRLGCVVRGRSRAYQAASGLLLAVELVIAAASFAAATAPSNPEAYMEALEHWLLACSILLLAGAGMVRWYSERRNHMAQAARYDDLLRAFRRAEDLLRHHGPLDHELRQRLFELGEMALDESEAWLKAHRDKPLEPMAGA